MKSINGIDWKINNIPERLILKNMQIYNISYLLSKIFLEKKYTDDEIYSSIYNSKDIAINYINTDFEKAGKLISKNLKSHKKILIFGDYDVDGTTGSSALYLFLNSIDCDAKIYIPHRISEGYGLSVKGINNAIEWGANLIISCDCGINAIQEVAYAKSKGLDIIVTDHHTPDTNLPAADAIINPNQTDCQYPFKGLCGGAVIFKLMQAVSKLLNLHDQF